MICHLDNCLLTATNRTDEVESWDEVWEDTTPPKKRDPKNTRDRLVRAALESIAYQSRDVLHCFEEDTGLRADALQVDGGATANDFLMQFQADLLGIPVRRPEVLETTALGAAYLAGLAVGFWSDRAEIETHWREGRRFEPQMPEARRDELYAGWLSAVERSRRWHRE